MLPAYTWIAHAAHSSRLPNRCLDVWLEMLALVSGTDWSSVLYCSSRECCPYCHGDSGLPLARDLLEGLLGCGSTASIQVAPDFVDYKS